MNKLQEKKEKWMERHGFDENGTYIALGDTYAIKDELKENGWKYDNVAGWHKADPTGFDGDIQFIPIEEVIVFTAWGEGAYKEGAKEYFNQFKCKDAGIAQRSVYLEDESFSGLRAILTKKGSYISRFGLNYIYTFHTPEDYELVWFTTKQIPQKEGDEVTISGRVKDRKEYRGINQTIVNYCKLK